MFIFSGYTKNNPRDRLPLGLVKWPYQVQFITSSADKVQEMDPLLHIYQLEWHYTFLNDKNEVFQRSSEVDISPEEEYKYEITETNM